jgi:uncharacterized protein YjiS (DUF1127 family)
MTASTRIASSASLAVVQPDGWLRRAVGAFVRAYRIQRGRLALRALSDETLRDIGVARSEIDFLAEALVNDPTMKRG